MQYYFYYVIIPDMVFILKLTHNRQDASGRGYAVPSGLVGTSRDTGTRIRLLTGFCRDTT